MARGRKPRVQVGEDGRPEAVAKPAKIGRAQGSEPEAVPAPPPNVADATVLRHFRLAMQAKTTLNEANGIYRSALKAAKADGVDTGELVAMMKAKAQEPGDVVAALEKRLRYFALAGIPVGTQLSLFKAPALSAEVTDEQSEWDADTTGYKAGREGASMTENKWQAGTRNHSAWARGYLRGQATIAKELGRNAKIASTRRDRKPKEGEEPTRELGEQPENRPN